MRLKGRPLSLGVLSNPRSGRNRKGLPALRCLLAAQPAVLHRETGRAADIATALAEFRERQLDLIVINGGDGTLQAALTTLFRQGVEPWPLLAVLAGGSTNVTAGDLGLRGPPRRALPKLLAWAAAPDAGCLVQRPVLRVQAPGQEPLCGFVFGAGTIVRGIEFYHQRVAALSLRDDWASGLTALRAAAAVLGGDAGYTAAVPISISLDGGPAQSQDYLLILASTLERLLLGWHPYWGQEAGPLHYTAIRARPRYLPLALPGLLWGWPNRFGTPANGYLSHNLHELRLLMDRVFALDGELYPTDSQAGPLVVDTVGPLSFVRL